MKDYKGYLIDLDGIMYNGMEKIEEVCEFVRMFKVCGILYLFVMNNFFWMLKQVVDKLMSFDILVFEEQVFMMSMVIVQYIVQQKKDVLVYVIGEEGICQVIEENGLSFGEENVDFVVVGIDCGIIYEKLVMGCFVIRNGVWFILINGDVVILIERGLLLGNGLLMFVLMVLMGVEFVFIGKFEFIIMEQVMCVFGMDIFEIFMVGDNYVMDIMVGINVGMDMLLVYMGVIKCEYMVGYDQKLIYVIDFLIEWIEYL